MWYVVQVRTGTEENIRLQCRRQVPEAVLEHCFIPYYEEKNVSGEHGQCRKKSCSPDMFFLLQEN